VVVKLAGTDLGVVDVYAVGCSRDLSEPVPVMATACGEAAHPDRDTAVRKALHEFASARSRKAFMHGPFDVVLPATPPGYLDHWRGGHPPERLVEEDRALQAMLDWTRMGTARAGRPAAGHGAVPPLDRAPADLPTWRRGRPARHRHRRGAGRRARRAGGAAALRRRRGRGEGAGDGLEVETMSYGRIGERGVRRLVEHDEGLAVVGADPGGWARVHLTAAAEERLGGPAWFDRAGADRRVGALYALYREPGRHVVAEVLGVVTRCATRTTPTGSPRTGCPTRCRSSPTAATRGWRSPSTSSTSTRSPTTLIGRPSGCGPAATSWGWAWWWRPARVPARPAGQARADVRHRVGRGPRAPAGLPAAGLRPRGGARVRRR
jgi:hypothetical protein